MQQGSRGGGGHFRFIMRRAGADLSALALAADVADIMILQTGIAMLRLTATQHRQLAEVIQQRAVTVAPARWPMFQKAALLHMMLARALDADPTSSGEHETVEP